VRQGTDLIGAVLIFHIGGEAMRVRIAGISPDWSDRTASVLLHDFRIEPSGEPLCSADPDGNRLGFPLAGRTLPDGRFVAAEAGAFEVVCTSGAQGKCVRFGYHPWRTAADGRAMRDYYNACVRLLRADYCGDGQAWTREGVQVDIWDDLGIQKADSRDDPVYSFEAGWSPEGAVCVARTRVAENVTLDHLKRHCPRLAALPACDEGAARAAGALLFNRSR
jgi:hypothetical protein